MSGALLNDGVVALRAWTVDDAQDIVDCLDGDPEILRWLDGVPQPYTIDHARAYIRGEIVGEEEKYAIVDAGDGRILGSIGIRPLPEGDVGEIGYWVCSEVRGRGVVTRALVLLAQYALREAGYARLQLYADPENVPSCRAAERAGFVQEGLLRERHWNARLGRRQDHAVYGILVTDLA